MKRTVQKAYLLDEGKALCVLADSQGLVFLPDVREWREPSAHVVRFGDVYERCWDVPAAWCGVVPWWPSDVPAWRSETESWLVPA